MGEGRVSASIFLISLLCMLVFHSNMIQAKTYIVGDEKGWSFGVQNWPSGKTFKEGDILVFNYNARFHNVLVVNETVYKSCVFHKGESKVYDSGADKITLAKGANYFICGYLPHHCEKGEKIAVNVI